MKIFLPGKEPCKEKRLFPKLLILMNLTVLFLTVACLQVSALGFAQKITLSVKNVPLSETFSAIEQQSEYKFFYDNKLVKKIRNISVDLHNVAVTEVLDELMKNQSLTYSIVDHTIVIQRKNKKEIAAAYSVKSVGLQRFSARSRRLRLNVAPITEFKVEGKVVDENGEPLSGVSIQEKGTQQSTSTNVEGMFSMDVLDRNATLVFSFVGYESQEISIAGQTSLNVTLKESTSRLDEVVVVGYGTQKRATLTGSVASVGNRELKRSPTVSLSNSISGLLPGVVASNRSGEPGRDDASILIRGRSTTGDNTPLIVIDGIPGSAGWAQINPNDVESISVLKDASAAIYGAQAANGVILITTKRGSIGTPTIDYTFNQGISTPTRVPRMADSYTYGEFVNQLLVERNQSPRYTDEELQKFRDGSDPLNYPNTNWLDAVLRKATPQSQHNLSVRGGTENVKYSVSGSFANQKGIFKNGSTNFKTYSLRSNLDAKINKYIQVGLDVNAGLDDGNYPAFSTTTTFQFARINFPYQPVYYPNGLPSAGLERGNNPAIMSGEATGNNNERSQRYQAKASVDVMIPWVDGLGIDGFFAYINNIDLTKNFQTPWTVYNYDKSTDTYTSLLGGGILLPQLRQGMTNGRSTLLNFRIKYNKQINDHSINSFIAAEQSEGYSNNFQGFRRNYISPAIDELFAGDLKDQEATGTASETGRRNFFGRVSYGYKDKYLFDFNFRYDGSAIFPEGKQYGFFPGVSAAYRISEESFIKERLDFINDLKLRASWGEIGNDRVSAFQYLSTYTIGVQGYNLGQTPSLAPGLIGGVTPNPTITWEVARTTNIGLDGDLWNSALGFTVDVFKSKRSNILAKRDLAVPAYTGLVLPNENIGVVENKGIEVELSHAKRTDGFSYRVAGNISYSKNKIIDVSEASNVPDWQKAEGHIIGANNYYRAIGIFRTQEEVDASPVVLGTVVGDLKYEDINDDGVINASDMVRMDKTNIPEMIFGLNLSMDYKNFSLFANFAGQARAWQYIWTQAGLNGNSLQELIENRYRPGSMDSKYPRLPSLAAEVNGQRSSFWLRDASFARLKTLELGYTVPQELLSRIKIKHLRVYVNGNNLFTLDKLKNFDPEGTSEAGDFYPQSKIYNLGFNLTF
ncbi:TonB-linked outer membrane protein, SusC/RagA family [Parapedobacter indicus]|uniref:TonB-linked outer membrane protein, SusC/RagA family n=2 Tax=Parapedobacter indicus TaxID=1477437 RepID=A0A1I3LK16_9SPHI|nr:TonB-linked SusC/RagA family outer membrane protein [Parapedobacter indicus]SFI85074.1 TonB-linked outer membrane protein, SusC/RagA family [Parapedobacter indicus]